MAKRLVLGVVAAGLLAANAGALWALESPGGHPQAKVTVPTPTPGAQPARLVRYGDCAQVLAGLRAEAQSEVGPYGWSGQSALAYDGPMPRGAVADGVATPAAAPASSSSAAASTATPGFSTTNDQEAGVDEPDTAKTDGHLLVTLRSQPAGLEVADVTAGAAHLDAFVPLGTASWSAEGLFLTGGYAVVLTHSLWSSAPSSEPATTAYIVSLADPHRPSVARTFDFEGTVEGARLIGGQVVLILTNTPDLGFVTPQDPSPGAAAAASAANRAIVDRATLADWLPGVRSSSGGAKPATPGCADVVHPTVASGVGTVSIVSFSLTATEPGSETTFVGDAQTVYVSTDAVYVAATSWADQAAAAPESSVAGPPSYSTAIYGFSITDPAHPVAIGSGQVEGQLIGQYALSEYQGDLRVATTVGYPNPAPGEGSAPATLSDNRVTVLRPSAQKLVEVGRISGLGQGEKIYSVRYEGPLAYVVTFNQTDPLYVVDLSHPAAPVLDGSLALTGYSSFLQPLGDGLLFGIGRGVNDRLAPTTLQLSVFDVANPRVPVLKSRQQVPDAASTAENDPHALMWWPADRVLAFPVTDYRTGALTVDVWQVGSDGSLSLAAQLTPPTNTGGYGYPAPGPAGEPGTYAPGADAVGGGAVASVCLSCGGGAVRSLVVGSNLWTVSPGGIMANDMHTWNRDVWLPFA